MSEIIGTCGVVLIVAGCYFVHPSLSLLVGGGALLFVGVMMNLRGKNKGKNK